MIRGAAVLARREEMACTRATLTLIDGAHGQNLRVDLGPVARRQHHLQIKSLACTASSLATHRTKSSNTEACVGLCAVALLPAAACWRGCRAPDSIPAVLGTRICGRACAAKGFPETAQVLAWARGSGSRKPGRRVPAMHLQR